MTQRQRFVWYVVMTVIVCCIFSVTFSIGIIYNANFDIFDFCFNLSTDLIGAAITAGIFGVFLRTRTNYFASRMGESDQREDLSDAEGPKD
ncbi:MAG: hypothetical protein FWH40_05210 [Coriobacteriia bacterium]|nr:hypothetical protein [Coriobacteriia bacterium]